MMDFRTGTSDQLVGFRPVGLKGHDNGDWFLTVILIGFNNSQATVQGTKLTQKLDVGVEVRHQLDDCCQVRVELLVPGQWWGG